MENTQTWYSGKDDLTNNYYTWAYIVLDENLNQKNIDDFNYQKDNLMTPKEIEEEKAMRKFKKQILKTSSNVLIRLEEEKEVA